LFNEWPEEALRSVAQKFLAEIDYSLSSDIQESISVFMASVHKSVNEASAVYLQNDKRYNYTTPKSFLEQIALYKSLLHTKSKQLEAKTQRLNNGLTKLESATRQVDALKDKLAEQEIEVKKKNDEADMLIKIVGDESKKVSQEKAMADVEQANVRIIDAQVRVKQEECEKDLRKAMPALEAAQKALDTLDKTSLTEMRSFASPPSGVMLVSAAVICLLAPGGKVPKDKSWKAAKVMMGNVDKFLSDLKNYDKDNIHENCRREVKPYLNDVSFKPELIRAQSQAAAGLCSWVVNILKYYDVYMEVLPKKLAFDAANAELQAARDKLARVEQKVKDLEERLQLLTRQFDAAVSDKEKCEKEASSTAIKISIANRLVVGLSSENMRWNLSVRCELNIIIIITNQ